jgi:hypothetical protein
VLVRGLPQPRRGASSLSLPGERWTELGTIDPVTGRADVDWSRAADWVPFEQFMAIRRWPS